MTIIEPSDQGHAGGVLAKAVQAARRVLAGPEPVVKHGDKGEPGYVALHGRGRRRGQPRRSAPRPAAAAGGKKQMPTTGRAAQVAREGWKPPKSNDTMTAEEAAAARAQSPYARGSIDAMEARGKQQAGGKRGKQQAAVDSLTAHGGPRGLSPEREKLHDQIIDEHLEGQVRSTNPTATFLGGGPASGKSTVLGNSPQKGVLIDSDAIKGKQERTKAKDATAATYVHEESGLVAMKVQAASIDSTFDFTLDGTGDSSIEKLRSKVEEARRSGYATKGMYVTVDTDEAVRRANARGAKTGRVVPESVIRATHSAVSVTLPQAIDEDLFDELTLWDTSTTPPTLVGEKPNGGAWAVKDETAWQRFLAKGNPVTKARTTVDGEEAVAALVAASNGASFEDSGLPDTAEHRAFWTDLAADIARIKAEGHEVQVPGDWTTMPDDPGAGPDTPKGGQGPDGDVTKAQVPAAVIIDGQLMPVAPYSIELRGGLTAAVSTPDGVAYLDVTKADTPAGADGFEVVDTADGEGGVLFDLAGRSVLWAPTAKAFGDEALGADLVFTDGLEVTFPAGFTGKPWPASDAGKVFLLEKRQFTTATRGKLADEGKAMADGSYPIATVADLRNAMQAFGRAPEGKRAALKAHIRRRARALGAEDQLGPSFAVAKHGDKGDPGYAALHGKGRRGSRVGRGGGGSGAKPPTGGPTPRGGGGSIEAAIAAAVRDRWPDKPERWPAVMDELRRAMADGEGNAFMLDWARRIARSMGSGPVAKAAAGPPTQVDVAKRFTLGPLYPATPGGGPVTADLLDAHEEFVTDDDLQEAVWDYTRSGDRTIRLQHGGVEIGEWVELMCIPAPVTVDLALPGGETVTKSFATGTPFMGVIWNDIGWELVRKGLIRGYSFGGSARKMTVELAAA